MVNEHALTDVHQEHVAAHVTFLRRKREQCISEVAAEFKELKESRLIADSYSSEDVEEMFDGLLATIRMSMKSELQNAFHSNVLLVKQVLEQAESNGLTVDMDIPSTEDGALLQAVAVYEEAICGYGNGPGSKVGLTVKASIKKPSTQALPVIKGGNDPELVKEVQTLRDDKEQLLNQFQKLQIQCTTILKDKTAATNAKNASNAQLEALQAAQAQSGTATETTELKGKLARLEAELKAALEANANDVAIQNAVNNGLENLPTDAPGAGAAVPTGASPQLQQELAALKAELADRLEKSKQFTSMRSMLAKKTKVIKTLREELTKCGINLDDIEAMEGES